MKNIFFTSDHHFGHKSKAAIMIIAALLTKSNIV